MIERLNAERTRRCGKSRVANSSFGALNHMPFTDAGQEPRHVGTLEPLWNLFDLTPEGRPDWHEQLSYT
jgi:predicted dithiol-disulfide oxidoreductase (DUF899 family)